MLAEIMSSGKKRDNAEKLSIFKGPFTGLTDVYGCQDLDSGKIFQVKMPVTDELILAHLRGQKRYGVYLLVDRRTRAVVVDFDTPDTWWPKEFVSCAKKYRIPSYIESSKSKGHHVWIFGDPWVTAAKARCVVRHILGEIDASETEVFPKHDVLADALKFGSFVFAPLFGRSVLQKVPRTVFLREDTLQPYSDQWDFLESIQPVSDEVLDEIIEINGLHLTEHPVKTNPQPTAGNPKVSFGLLPCARKMLEGVSSNQRVVCFRLGISLKAMGLSYEMAAAVLNTWALRNRPIDEKQIISWKEIASQTADAYKEYQSYGCEDPTVQEYCQPDCHIKRSQCRNEKSTNNEGGRT